VKDGLRIEGSFSVVQAAKALGKIKIVSRDWLTASLHANPIRPVPERPFLLQNLVKPSKKIAEGKNGTNGKTDSGLNARMRSSISIYPILHLCLCKVLIKIPYAEDPFIEKKSPKASKSAKNNAPRTFTFTHVRSLT